MPFLSQWLMFSWLTLRLNSRQKWSLWKLYIFLKKSLKFHFKIIVVRLKGVIIRTGALIIFILCWNRSKNSLFVTFTNARKGVNEIVHVNEKIRAYYINMHALSLPFQLLKTVSTKRAMSTKQFLLKGHVQYWIFSK